jgi:hypothetical protein
MASDNSSKWQRRYNLYGLGLGVRRVLNLKGKYSFKYDEILKPVKLFFFIQFVHRRYTRTFFYNRHKNFRTFKTLKECQVDLLLETHLFNLLVVMHFLCQVEFWLVILLRLWDVGNYFYVVYSQLQNNLVAKE